MALSAASELVYEVDSFMDQLPVKASAVIYRGAALGRTSGYARGLVAGDEFAGFALESVTGTSSDGGITVNARRRGRVKLAISSLAITDVGKVVYASADGTFTLTQSTNSPIGRVAQWVSSGIGIINFDAGFPTRVTGITALTDSSGGTANNTVQAIGGSFSQSEIANNFADVAGKINEIIAILK